MYNILTKACELHISFHVIYGKHSTATGITMQQGMEIYNYAVDHYGLSSV